MATMSEHCVIINLTQRGREATAMLSRKRQTVRAQGIGGARSGRGKYKKHAVHVFYICRDGTPAKPGFLRSKKCAQGIWTIRKMLLIKKRINSTLRHLDTGAFLCYIGSGELEMPVF
jgi:hypothetical protein